MLVLSRKVGQKICVGPDVVITVVAAGRGQVRIGIEAPADVPVHREEVYKALREFKLDDVMFGDGAALN